MPGMASRKHEALVGCWRCLFALIAVVLTAGIAPLLVRDYSKHASHQFLQHRSSRAVHQGLHLPPQAGVPATSKWQVG